MKESPKAAYYQLKVELQEIQPLIWRQLLVRSDLTLRALHSILQAAMGWTNSHLHQFIFEDRTCYGRPDPDGELDMLDDSKVRLGKVVTGKGQRFIYQYDFGDAWDHAITVEDVLPAGKETVASRCLAGARACPPEDVGGSGGYEEFLEIINDPSHPEHKDRLRWVGGAFNPEGFDINRVNRELLMLNKPAKGQKTSAR